jgi:hypothetical protein
MDIDRDLREQCADPEGFLGCLLLSLPQTDGEPTMMLTCVSACALLHCRESSEVEDEDDENDDPED